MTSLIRHLIDSCALAKRALTRVCYYCDIMIRSKLLKTIALAAALISSVHAVRAEQFDINDYQGRVVYLDFWASWCSPCRQSFPFMNELHAEYADKGLSIVSVNIDYKKADAEEFLAETPALFKVIYDPESELAGEYDVRAMPTSFVFDRNGKLLGSHTGFKIEDIEELRTSLVGLIDAD